MLHDAGCAVWTDAHHSEGEARFLYRKVLAAIDLDTGESEAVIKAAACLAQQYQADLRLLHVVENPPAAWDVDYAPYRRALSDAADARMRSLRHETGIAAPYDIAEGRPADEIRRLALEHKADIVVTGRGHAQGGLSRAWSQLYPIIREAPCPVLSV